MNARKKLQEIKEYYDATRMAGHTTGMLEGANYTDNALILTHSMKMGEHIKKMLGSPKSVTVQSLHAENMLRGFRKPLFIDNAALWLLLSEALAEFEDLERENKRLKENLVGFCPP